jgi:1-acyl-sn-glycerol-3-phosphate acyltransferase
LRLTWIYLNLIFWTFLFGLSSFIVISITGKSSFFKFFGIIWGKTLSFIFNIKLVVKGRNHLLSDNNYIFSANHSSLIDIPLLLIATNRYTVFVAKKELSKIPIFKSIIDKAGFIFVDRKNNDEAIKSMNKLTSDIKKNPRSIAVFPEGTRTEDGKLKEFKKGATVLSLNTKIPIVPVGISGSFKWAKKRLFDFSKSKIIIEFSKPINPNNFSYSQREDLNNLIKTNVEKMIRV